MTDLTVLLLFLAVLAVVGLSGRIKTSLMEAKYREGTYIRIQNLVGMNDAYLPLTGIDWVMTSEAFVFVTIGGRELGRIPKSSILKIVLKDMTIYDQTPAERTWEKCRISIFWTAASGLITATSFEPTGSFQDFASHLRPDITTKAN